MSSFRTGDIEQLKPQPFGAVGLRAPHWARGRHVSGVVTSAPRALTQVLASALTVALSGRCDRDVLGLLLALPEDEGSWLAVKELCGLPRAEVFALIVRVSRNLDLRNFIYRVRGWRWAWPVRCLSGALGWVGEGTAAGRQA